MQKVTVTEQQNYDTFQGRWSWDGFGLNRKRPEICDRIAKFEHPEDAHTQQIGKQLAEFAHEAHRLTVRSFSINDESDPPKDRPPHVFVTLDLNEIMERAGGDTICTVEVKREDGKVARFHLRVGYSEVKQQVFGVLTTQSKNQDYQKTSVGHFVDWSK